MWFGFLFCLAGFALATCKHVQKVPRNGKAVTSERLLSVLEDFVSYYAEHASLATPDFAFGIRSVEGETERIIEAAEGGTYTDEWLKPGMKDRILTLNLLAGKSVKRSVSSIKESNLKYYKKMKPIISVSWRPYELPPQFAKIQKAEMFPKLTGDMKDFAEEEEDLSEEASDNCMAGLMGVGNYTKCSVSSCWKRMTENGKVLYHPTHQILWLLLGEQHGCKDKLSKLAIKSGYPGGYEEILQQKCAGIVAEMKAIAHNGIKLAARDIFLEQGFVCGSVGLLNAMKFDWIAEALQWPDKQVKCLIQPEMKVEDDIDFEAFERSLASQKKRWLSRKLQVDTTNEDGCSTHMTSVAAGFFAVCLRLFFDPYYKARLLDPYIDISMVRKRPAAETNRLAIFLILICLVGIFLFFRRKFAIALKYVAYRARGNSASAPLSA